MKKLFILILLFISNHVSSQKVDVSIAGGAAWSRTIIKSYGKYESESEQLSPLTTYNFGLRFNVHLSNKVEFKTGIYFTQKGYNISYPITQQRYFDINNAPIDTFRKFNLNYIEIPAMFSIPFFKLLRFNTGFGLNININNPKHGTRLDTPFLLGFSYQKNRFSVDLLSSYGVVPFKTIFHEYGAGYRHYYDFFHRQLSVTLGYAINKKIDGCQTQITH